ncbi:lipopolysaccharide transport periplasmic protein LptA [Yoonia sp.]|uniref:lipopolysaccharide transport periplasmic protein LptA n=1 Tax=Yoonia sp. TaxID=2212373 RepID=UPI0019DC615F|nr:lipopolysaccharide transport periplasmic protein LptA [Yoonia sp.]MBE0413070.1 lipopolysaccharide transport periplasmic protein LptA [Yoonia sp.]
MTKFFAFTVALFLIGTAASIAQSNVNLGGINVDPSAAIEVTADSLSVDQDTGTAVFSGKVLISQGELRLSANRVEVIYSDETGDITRLIATGDVLFVTDTDAAEAQNADYDITAGILTLTGDVMLTQGASAISAGRMVLNVATGAATMDGRVRTVLQQGNN